MKVIYLTYGQVLDGVFQSQVVSYVNELIKKNIDVTLLSFVSPRSIFVKSERGIYKKRFAEIKEALYGRVKFFIHPPQKFSIIIWPILCIFFYLIYDFIKRKKIIFHCRETKATYIANKLKLFNKNIKVIFDCRSVTVDEYIFTNGYSEKENKSYSKRILKQLIKLEEEACTKSDAISYVSSKLKTYMEEKYKTICKNSIISPSLVYNQNFKFDKDASLVIRKKLNLEGRLIFIYSGNTAKWQMVKETINLFSIIENKYDNAFLLIISNSVKEIEKIIEEYKVRKENYLITSLKHNEINSYLSAGDIGILLREDISVNQVASPVKFAEYLICRLPLIISKNIGDYSELIEKNRCGIILEHHNFNDKNLINSIYNFINFYIENKESFKEKCRVLAGNKLSSENNIKNYISLYKRL